MTRVLVIDGSAGVRERIQATLDQKAIIMFAASRREALASAFTEPADVALVGVTDPVEDALDLVHALIDIRPDLPILLLVDRHLQSAVAPLFNKAVSGTLPRTFDPIALLEKLETLANEHPFARPEESSGGDRPPETTTATARPQAPLPIEERCPTLRPLAMELAHRLKNPLVSITTFTHLLNERFEDPVFREEFYRMVLQEIEKLDGTVNLLSEIAALPAPESDTCDINGILARILDSENEVIRRAGIAITIKSPRIFAGARIDTNYARFAITMALRFVLGNARASSDLTCSISTDSVSGPVGTPTIEISLRYLGTPISHQLRGLELVLADLALHPFLGRVDVDTDDEGRSRIRLTFPASPAGTTVIPGETLAGLLLGRQTELTFQNWADRRVSSEPIHFADRRLENRRRTPSTIMVQDRRRILGIFEEVVL